MANYVIIGNGTAAVGCIEGIRTMDAASPVTVISGETTPPTAARSSPTRSRAGQAPTG